MDRSGTARRRMSVLLIVLVVLAALSWISYEPPVHRSAAHHIVWGLFLFGLPLLLAGFSMAGFRWSLMGGVMYGTVGLALDISTVIHELTHEGGGPALYFSLITGLLNAAVITVGGQGFLDVSGRPSLPVDHSPSHPSPSSKGRA